MKTLLAAIVAVFLLPLSVARASSGAPTALVNGIVYSNGYVECLDVPGFATADVALQGYGCNYGSNQTWTLTDAAIVNGQRFFTIRSSSSNKCMAGTGLHDSASVIQTTCN